MSLLLEDRVVRRVTAETRQIDLVVLVAIRHPEPTGGKVGFGLRCSRRIDDELEDEVWETIKFSVLEAVKFAAGRLPTGGIEVEVSVELPEDWPVLRRVLSDVIGESVGDAVRRAFGSRESAVS